MSPTPQLPINAVKYAARIKQLQNEFLMMISAFSK